MVTLLEGGAYLVNGTQIIPDNQDAVARIAAETGKQVTKEEAAKETIAYGILESHNTSGNTVSYTHLDCSYLYCLGCEYGGLLLWQHETGKRE